MLIDGGFSSSPSCWSFVRHLEKIDSVLITRFNENNCLGLVSLFNKLCSGDCSAPKVGRILANFPDLKNLPAVDSTKNDIEHNLEINLVQSGQNILLKLDKAGILQPQHLFRPQDSSKEFEPIELYHRIGFGTLNLYILNPLENSKLLKEFLLQFNEQNRELFSNVRMQTSGSNFLKNLQPISLSNITSISLVLCWLPAQLDEQIVRVLLPGSTPTQKLMEIFSKLQTKHPNSELSILLSHENLKRSEFDKLVLESRIKQGKIMSNLKPSSGLNEKTASKSTIRNRSMSPAVRLQNEKTPQFYDSLETLNKVQQNKNLNNAVNKKLVDAKSSTGNVDKNKKPIPTSKVPQKVGKSNLNKSNAKPAATIKNESAVKRNQLKESAVNDKKPVTKISSTDKNAKKPKLPTNVNLDFALSNKAKSLGSASSLTSTNTIKAYMRDEFPDSLECLNSAQSILSKDSLEPGSELSLDKKFKDDDSIDGEEIKRYSADANITTSAKESTNLWDLASKSNKEDFSLSPMEKLRNEPDNVIMNQSTLSTKTVIETDDLNNKSFMSGIDQSSSFVDHSISESNLDSDFEYKEEDAEVQKIFESEKGLKRKVLVLENNIIPPKEEFKIENEANRNIAVINRVEVENELDQSAIINENSKLNMESFIGDINNNSFLTDKVDKTEHNDQQQQNEQFIKNSNINVPDNEKDFVDKDDLTKLNEKVPKDLKEEKSAIDKDDIQQDDKKIKEDDKDLIKELKVNLSETIVDKAKDEEKANDDKKEKVVKFDENIEVQEIETKLEPKIDDLTKKDDDKIEVQEEIIVPKNDVTKTGSPTKDLEEESELIKNIDLNKLDGLEKLIKTPEKDKKLEDVVKEVKSADTQSSPKIDSRKSSVSSLPKEDDIIRKESLISLAEENRKASVTSIQEKETEDNQSRKQSLVSDKISVKDDKMTEENLSKTNESKDEIESEKSDTLKTSPVPAKEVLEESIKMEQLLAHEKQSPKFTKTDSRKSSVSSIASSTFDESRKASVQSLSKDGDISRKESLISLSEKDRKSSIDTSKKAEEKVKPETIDKEITKLDDTTKPFEEPISSLLTSRSSISSQEAKEIDNKKESPITEKDSIKKADTDSRKSSVASVESAASVVDGSRKSSILNLSKEEEDKKVEDDNRKQSLVIDQQSPKLTKEDSGKSSVSSITSLPKEDINRKASITSISTEENKQDQSRKQSLIDKDKKESIKEEIDKQDKNDKGINAKNDNVFKQSTESTPVHQSPELGISKEQDKKENKEEDKKEDKKEDISKKESLIDIEEKNKSSLSSDKEKREVDVTDTGKEEKQTPVKKIDPADRPIDADLQLSKEAEDKNKDQQQNLSRKSSEIEINSSPKSSLAKQETDLNNDSLNKLINLKKEDLKEISEPKTESKVNLVNDLKETKKEIKENQKEAEIDPIELLNDKKTAASSDTFDSKNNEVVKTESKLEKSIIETEEKESKKITELSDAQVPLPTEEDNNQRPISNLSNISIEAILTEQLLNKEEKTGDKLELADKKDAKTDIKDENKEEIKNANLKDEQSEDSESIQKLASEVVKAVISESILASEKISTSKSDSADNKLDEKQIISPAITDSKEKAKELDKNLQQMNIDSQTEKDSSSKLIKEENSEEQKPSQNDLLEKKEEKSSIDVLDYSKNATYQLDNKSEIDEKTNLEQEVESNIVINIISSKQYDDKSDSKKSSISSPIKELEILSASKEPDNNELLKKENETIGKTENETLNKKDDKESSSAMETSALNDIKPNLINKTDDLSKTVETQNLTESPIENSKEIEKLEKAEKIDKPLNYLEQKPDEKNLKLNEELERKTASIENVVSESKEQSKSIANESIDSKNSSQDVKIIADNSSDEITQKLCKEDVEINNLNNKKEEIVIDSKEKHDSLKAGEQKDAENSIQQEDSKSIEKVSTDSKYDPIDANKLTSSKNEEKKEFDDSSTAVTNDIVKCQIVDDIKNDEKAADLNKMDEKTDSHKTANTDNADKLIGKNLSLGNNQILLDQQKSVESEKAIADVKTPTQEIKKDDEVKEKEKESKNDQKSANPQVEKVDYDAVNFGEKLEEKATLELVEIEKEKDPESDKKSANLKEEKVKEPNFGFASQSASYVVASGQKLEEKEILEPEESEKKDDKLKNLDKKSSKADQPIITSLTSNLDSKSIKQLENYSIEIIQKASEFVGNLKEDEVVLEPDLIEEVETSNSDLSGNQSGSFEIIENSGNQSYLQAINERRHSTNATSVNQTHEDHIIRRASESAPSFRKNSNLGIIDQISNKSSNQSSLSSLIGASLVQVANINSAIVTKSSLTPDKEKEIIETLSSIGSRKSSIAKDERLIDEKEDDKTNEKRPLSSEDPEYERIDMKEIQSIQGGEKDDSKIKDLSIKKELTKESSLEKVKSPTESTTVITMQSTIVTTESNATPTAINIPSFSITTIASQTDKKENEEEDKKRLEAEKKVDSWSKPLGLPSPYENASKNLSRSAGNSQSTNANNDQQMLTASISNDLNISSMKPCHFELVYISNHGEKSYNNVEFFKKCPTKNYVLSASNPSRETLDAMLEARKQVNDNLKKKDKQYQQQTVNLLPTHESESLFYWLSDRQKELEQESIEVAPSASRCSVTLQGHEDEVCSSYRIQF